MFIDYYTFTAAVLQELYLMLLLWQIRLLLGQNVFSKRVYSLGHGIPVVVWLAQSSPNVAGLRLAWTLIESSEHVHGKLAYVIGACAALRWAGSSSFTHSKRK